jgi:membrane protease YdiL (CAAX protease family)
MRLNVKNITSGKDPKLPVLDLFELSVIIAAVVILMTCDPFGMYRKMIECLRLHYPIFTKDPRLLINTSVYIGTFISKVIAIAFILALLAGKRISAVKNLAMTAPSSRNWIRWVAPFAVFSLCIRTYYANNPVVPNLPIRLVFPESMAIGNAIIVLSVLFVAPVIEELIFRGYMYDVVRRSFGNFLSILLTSALFAAAHIRQDFEPLDLGIIFVVGLILGVLRYKAASIWPAMALHFIYNFVSVAVGAVYYMILGY